MSDDQWDRVVDVVPVGSGGAALVAATLADDQGAEVIVVEKDPMLGGTTAVSGWGDWVHVTRGVTCSGPRGFDRGCGLDRDPWNGWTRLRNLRRCRAASCSSSPR